MLKEEYDEGRLQYLASQIASLAVDSFTPDQLGNIALEILVFRNKVENVLEKGSKEEKKRAKKALEQLKRLEASVIQLYILSRLRRQRSENLFLDYLTKDYSFLETR